MCYIKRHNPFMNKEKDETKKYEDKLRNTDILKDPGITDLELSAVRQMGVQTAIVLYTDVTRVSGITNWFLQTL